jgi:hypothetical protein
LVWYNHNPMQGWHSKSFLISTISPTLDIQPTLRTISIFIRSFIYVICFSQTCFTGNSDILFSDLAIIIIQILSTAAHDSIKVINSKDLLFKSLISSVSLFVPFPIRYSQWNSILVSISPCFGFFGSIIGSFLLCQTLNGKSRVCWSIVCVFFYFFVPLLRYIMHLKRKIHVYQWDECQPCHSCQ